MRIIDHPSPNFNARRHGGPPDMVVLHHTAMTSAGAALDRLADPAAEVSAHWLIDEAGQVYRMVAEEARAWHAGAGAWGGVGDVNSHSIGIELANPGHHPYPEPQMAALDDLLAQTLARWTIPPARVIAHSDMAPDRKTDPGPRFDWRRLALRGLSVWPQDPPAALPALAEPAVTAFEASARDFGYRCPPELALRAFRLRFRPWDPAPGPHAGDLQAIADLAARFGSASFV